MSISLKTLSELERLEAIATEQIAQAQKNRAEFIVTLEAARKDRADIRERVAACKQLLEKWEKIDRNFEAIEDKALEQIVISGDVVRSGNGTLANVRMVMKKEFPGALPDEQTEPSAS